MGAHGLEQTMCLGIALAGSDVPTEVVGHDLARRLHTRGNRPEYRFYYRDSRPRLPILRGGALQFARWGNARGRSRALPRTGWTWMETVNGGWNRVPAEIVEIPATYALERRGVWFLVETGIRGLLVPDERGLAVCYVICEPSSHYYRVMTGSERMPVLIGQRI